MNLNAQFIINPSTDGSSPLPRFAPVVPLEIAMKLGDALGDYHLLLAHDVLAFPEEYASVYANKGYTILMDNSLIELGVPMGLAPVLQACRVVGAQFLILPDVLGAGDHTRKLVRASLAEWALLEAQEKQGVNLLAVIQGIDYREQMDTLEYYSSEPAITGFCVPRCITEISGTRKVIVEKATQLARVHLLGFSDNLWDDVACARMPNVLGIDSAVPVRLGLKGRAIDFNNPDDPGKRGNYWETPFAHIPNTPQSIREVMHLVKTNCVRFRQAITR